MDVMTAAVLAVSLAGLSETHEHFKAQFEAQARSCKPDGGTSASCDGALKAASQLAQLRRVAAPSQPKPLPASCPAKQALPSCLEARFGKGVLVFRVTSDFVLFIAAGDRIRTLIGTIRPTGFVILFDTTDASPQLRAILQRPTAPVVDDLSNSTWRFEPSGSDRFFAEVSGEQFMSATPVVAGAHVLCPDSRKIEPLGGLVDVTLAGTGYHPEQTAQHPSYRYRSACKGEVIGSGVAGIRDGPYRPPNPRTEPVGPGCSKTECRFSLRGPNGRSTEIVFAVNEGAAASVRSVGDVNRDGVDDYAVAYNDAGFNSQQLYLSAATEWTSAASSRGLN